MLGFAMCCQGITVDILLVDHYRVLVVFHLVRYIAYAARLLAGSSR